MDHILLDVPRVLYLSDVTLEYSPNDARFHGKEGKLPLYKTCAENRFHEGACCSEKRNNSFCNEEKHRREGRIDKEDHMNTLGNKFDFHKLLKKFVPGHETEFYRNVLDRCRLTLCHRLNEKDRVRIEQIYFNAIKMLCKTNRHVLSDLNAFKHRKQSLPDEMLRNKPKGSFKASEKPKVKIVQKDNPTTKPREKKNKREEHASKTRYLSPGSFRNNPQKAMKSVKTTQNLSTLSSTIQHINEVCTEAVLMKLNTDQLRYLAERVSNLQSMLLEKENKIVRYLKNHHGNDRMRLSTRLSKILDLKFSVKTCQEYISTVLNSRENNTHSKVDDLEECLVRDLGMSRLNLTKRKQKGFTNRESLDGCEQSKDSLKIRWKIGESNGEDELFDVDDYKEAVWTLGQVETQGCSPNNQTSNKSRSSVSITEEGESLGKVTCNARARKAVTSDSNDGTVSCELHIRTAASLSEDCEQSVRDVSKDYNEVFVHHSPAPVFTQQLMSTNDCVETVCGEARCLHEAALLPLTLHYDQVNSTSSWDLERAAVVEGASPENKGEPVLLKNISHLEHSIKMQYEKVTAEEMNSNADLLENQVMNCKHDGMENCVVENSQSKHSTYQRNDLDPVAICDNSHVFKDVCQIASADLVEVIPTETLDDGKVVCCESETKTMSVYDTPSDLATMHENVEELHAILPNPEESKETYCLENDESVSNDNVWISNGSLETNCSWKDSEVSFEKRINFLDEPVIDERSTLLCMDERSTLLCMDERSTFHCMDERSTLHCMDERSTLHCMDEPSTPHCMDERSTLHCMDEPSTLHCMDERSTLLCMDERSNLLCMDERSNLHCMDERSTLHCMDKRSNLHCMDERSTLHCMDERSTLHCMDEPSTPHCMDERSTLHCMDEPSTLHCMDERSTLLCMNERSTLHCMDERSTLHCMDEPSTQHCMDERSTLHCMDSIISTSKHKSQRNLAGCTTHRKKTKQRRRFVKAFSKVEKQSPSSDEFENEVIFKEVNNEISTEQKRSGLTNIGEDNETESGNSSIEIVSEKSSDKVESPVWDSSAETPDETTLKLSHLISLMKKINAEKSSRELRAEKKEVENNHHNDEKHTKPLVLPKVQKRLRITCLTVNGNDSAERNNNMNELVASKRRGCSNEEGRVNKISHVAAKNMGKIAEEENIDGAVLHEQINEINPGNVHPYDICKPTDHEINISPENQLHLNVKLQGSVERAGDNNQRNEMHNNRSFSTEKEISTGPNTNTKLSLISPNKNQLPTPLKPNSLDATNTDEATDRTATDEATDCTVTNESTNRTVSEEEIYCTITDELENHTVTDQTTDSTVTKESTNYTVTDKAIDHTVTHESTNRTVTDEATDPTEEKQQRIALFNILAGGISDKLLQQCYQNSVLFTKLLPTLSSDQQSFNANRNINSHILLQIFSTILSKNALEDFYTNQVHLVKDYHSAMIARRNKNNARIKSYILLNVYGERMATDVISAVYRDETFNVTILSAMSEDMLREYEELIWKMDDDEDAGRHQVPCSLINEKFNESGYESIDSNITRSFLFTTNFASEFNVDESSDFKKLTLVIDSPEDESMLLPTFITTSQDPPKLIYEEEASGEGRRKKFVLLQENDTGERGYVEGMKQDQDSWGFIRREISLSDENNETGFVDDFLFDKKDTVEENNVKILQENNFSGYNFTMKLNCLKRSASSSSNESLDAEEAQIGAGNLKNSSDAEKYQTARKSKKVLVKKVKKKAFHTERKKDEATEHTLPSLKREGEGDQENRTVGHDRNLDLKGCLKQINVSDIFDLNGNKTYAELNVTGERGGNERSTDDDNGTLICYERRTEHEVAECRGDYFIEEDTFPSPTDRGMYFEAVNNICEEEEIEEEDFMRSSGNETINKWLPVCLLDLNAPFIIDNGCGAIKAGTADADLPRVIPTIIGRPNYKSVFPGECKEEWIGTHAQNYRGMLKLSHPLQRGIVRDWSAMEKIWDYMFELMEERPVIACNSLSTPLKQCEQIMEVMFERFEVPAYFSPPSPAMALYSAGQTTGLVFDSGDHVTHISPVYEGHVIKHACEHLDLAGRDISEQLSQLMAAKGRPFCTSAELEICREMKEKHCFVKTDDEEYVEKANYELPDGNIISLISERHAAAEILFRPNTIGLDNLGVHQLLLKCLARVGKDLEKAMSENIVLSGGTTKLAGLSERLDKETKPSASQPLKFISHQNAIQSVWQGAKIFSGLSTMESLWITKEEYIEHGRNIVHLKCF